MFEKKYILELFAMVEKQHEGTPFYKVFLEMVTNYDGSGASEYEIYYNFMLIFHRNDIEIRSLNWTNTNKIPENSNFDYVSVHSYLRI